LSLKGQVVEWWAKNGAGTIIQIDRGSGPSSAGRGCAAPAAFVETRRRSGRQVVGKEGRLARVSQKKNLREIHF